VIQLCTTDHRVVNHPGGSAPIHLPGGAGAGVAGDVVMALDACDETPVTLVRQNRLKGARMTFSSLHILLTALLCGILVFGAGVWRLRSWQQALVTGVLAGAAVFLWRLSANMPQLNEDGLPGFSANDWAAPVLAYVVLGGYTDLRPPTDPLRYKQLRALSGLICLAVNVITI
jgi:hypothetical protein